MFVLLLKLIYGLSKCIGSLEVPCTQQRLCDFEWVISNPQGRMGLISGIYHCQHPAEDKFLWSYTSPEFPMTQEITCSNSSYQNLFFVLVDVCRSNYSIYV